MGLVRLTLAVTPVQAKPAALQTLKMIKVLLESPRLDPTHFSRRSNRLAHKTKQRRTIKTFNMCSFTPPNINGNVCKRKQIYLRTISIGMEKKDARLKLIHFFLRV